MLTVRHLVALAALAVTGGAASACSSSGDDASASESAVIEAARFGPGLFRDDFNAYLKASGAYSDDDVHELAYLPTAAMMKPRVDGAPSTAEQRLFAYDKAFAAIKPSEVFENGVKTPFGAASTEALEEALRRHPVHIVIVPGIFSEFIPRTPFEELFSADTAARREFAIKGAHVKDTRLFVNNVAWDEASKRYLPTHGDVPLTGTKPNGEDALLRVASIDGKDGKPLVTVAYLRANLGSLEDFGTLKEDSDTYLHRIDKYFEAVGLPDNVYLMGYSRGTVTGLDLLVRAKKEGKPWASKVKGFLTHAGVIYGSQLADASFTSGPSTELLKVLEAFVGDEPRSVDVGGKSVKVLNLKSCRDPDILAGASNKAAAWPELVALAAVISRKNPKHPELGLEGIDAELPDAGRLSSFIALALGVPIPGAPADPSRAIVNVKLFDSNHCKNVASFKTTARAIIAGAASLTTRARLDWWKSNAVPSDVKYFALTGTMGDASSKENVWSHTTNDRAFDKGSIDFRSLRGNYYDFLSASNGIQLQDSQVSVERGRFWPELHNPGGDGPVFNPAQTAIQTYFMGTMGTHHWGLAFPRAFSTPADGRDCPAASVKTDPFASCGNPFPRTVLLETIATFVAQVALGAGPRETP